MDCNLSHVYTTERKYKNKLFGKIKHKDSMIMINLNLKYNSQDSEAYNWKWRNHYVYSHIIGDETNNDQDYS